MLKFAEKINITGESVIGETVVCTYSVVLDRENPEKIVVNQFQRDKELYKQHRAECRADFAAFEDYAYERQAALLKAAEK